MCVDMKIDKIMKKKKYGYTLVELLAVIAVVSIILSITIYFMGNIFDSVADKIDKTTKNMILDAANEYVIEYRNKGQWKENVSDEGNVTFCVSLNSLLETGYYDTDDEYVIKNKDKLLVSVIMNSKKVSKYSLIDVDDAIGICNYSISDSELNRVNGKIDIMDDSNENSIGNLEYQINNVKGKKYDVDINFLAELGIETIERTVPVYVAIVLDNSGSMVGTAWNNAKEAAIKLSETIINELDDSQVALIQYNEKPVLSRKFENKVLINADFFGPIGNTNVSGGIDLTSSLYKDLDVPDNAMFYTILLYDGEPKQYSYLKTKTGNSSYSNSNKSIYYDNFLSAYYNLNDTYNLLYGNSTSSSYVSNAGNYLMENINSKLIVIGYDFNNNSSDLKRVSTQDNEFCVNSHYDEKIYRYEERNMHDIDIKTHNLSYPFVYNKDDGSISSSNVGVGTESYAYYELDLTGYKSTDELELEFDYTMTTSSTMDYFFVRIDEKPERSDSKFTNYYCSYAGDWQMSSFSPFSSYFCNYSSDTTKTNIMGGKKYYIHLYYQQNSSSNKSMKINKITYSLSGQELIYDSLNGYNDKFYLSSEEESRIIFEPEVFDNKLGVSAKKYNTTSGGYQEIDLTGKEGTYLLTVNAKSNIGKGTIYVSENSIPPQTPANIPSISFSYYYNNSYCNFSNSSNVKCIYDSTANKNFNFKLDGGKKYYVHFINDTYSYTLGKHNFIINSVELIKLGDEISNVSMEDITSDGCSDDSLSYSSCLKKSSTYEYEFLYDNGSIISTNKEIPNSCSHNYIELDLSSNNSNEYVIVSFDSLISSESKWDIGNIIITESSVAPSLYSRACDIRTDDDCLVISSGTNSSSKNSFSKLQGGKKYYIHFTYCKDGSGDSGNDYFAINKFKLYKGIDNVNIGFEKVVNYKDYTFKEQENKSLISTNKGVGNTKSHRYVKIDLNDYNSDERFLLEIDNFLSARDYGNIYMSRSEKLDYNSIWSRSYSNFNKPEILSKLLTGGRVYYLHFIYSKDSSGDGYDDFYRIDDIRVKHYVASDLKSVDLSKDKSNIVNYNFIKEGDKYVSNNNTTYSAAYSYFELDLSGYSEDSTINLIVNATLDNSSYMDYICVTSSTNVPIFSSSCSNRAYINKGTYNYTLSLKGGKKHYVHLLNSNSSVIANMTINSVRIEEKLLDEVKKYCYYSASVNDIINVFSQLSNKVMESVPKLAAKSVDIILTTKFDNIAFHIEDSEGKLVDTITKPVDLSSSDLNDGVFEIKFEDKYKFILDENVKCDKKVCTLNLKLFDIKLRLYYDNDKVSEISLDEEMIPVVTVNYENGEAIN